MKLTKADNEKLKSMLGRLKRLTEHLDVALGTGELDVSELEGDEAEVDCLGQDLNCFLESCYDDSGEERP